MVSKALYHWQRTFQIIPIVTVCSTGWITFFAVTPGIPQVWEPRGAPPVCGDAGLANDDGTF